MGVEILVIALAALVVPIVLILTAIIFDVVVVAWVAYRWTHDSAVPALSHFMYEHVAAPIGRVAHTSHLLPRPH